MTEGNKYNVALLIFFIPYILFEIPSNIILKKLKPRIWLSLCMFGFGLGKHRTNSPNVLPRANSRRQ